MANVFALVLPFFALILCGYVTARCVGKAGPDAGDQMRWLNIFILYLALPALFFKLVSKTPLSQLARMDFVVVSLAATYAVFLLVFFAGRLGRRASLPESTMQGLAAAYGNIGYMGPGLALAAFGERAAVPLALIFCFENALHFIVAPAMMAVTGGQTTGRGQLLATIARRIAFHPFILSTLAGVAAAAVDLQLPSVLQRLVDTLAQAAAPCALFAMGVTLALRPLRRMPSEILYIVPAKLILHPLLMYLALSVFGNFDPVWVQTAVLLACLPTATNVFIIGQQYGVWQERASATILVTTVLSVATVSAILYCLLSGALPPDLFP